MKHNSDTCLNKYNVLMVNLVLHPLFIEPPHFFLEFHVPLWLVPDGITFPLMSNYFGVALWFCVISFTTFVKSLGPHYKQPTNQFCVIYEETLHYKIDN
jgi:hypothetical protein